MDLDPDAGLLRDDGPPGESWRGNHDHDHDHDHHGYHHPQHFDDYRYLDDDCSPTTDHATALVSYPNSKANHDSNSAPADARHAVDPVNPDIFYKSYRALHPDSDPDSFPMASTAVRPSLRSNGDGTTPRHPALPVNRSLPRPNARSASSPLDGRLSAAGTSRTPTGKPSVKDLRKRFDQNGSSSYIPRPGAAPTPPRAMQNSEARTSHGATAYSTLRAGGSQDSSMQGSNEPAGSRAQRSKLVVQDSISSNAQSFASRIGKPRSAVNGKSVSSKSMTQLSHTVPPEEPPSSSPTTTSRTHGLLFGEIPPDRRGAPAVGFGIEGVRPRRTSESNHFNPFSHHRSLSDPDAEPPSPSSWYRQVNPQQDGSPDPAGSHPKGHTRSQSDAAASLSSVQITRKPIINTSLSQSTSASKLPLSVRKLSSPTSSTSPPSTRSNSPSALKRSQASARVARASPAASRAKTPVFRAKTPTQAATGRKPPPRALATPSNNTRLQAYIAAPAPKLSPTLRSSRPRQPVSVASTASSRMKETDGARFRDRSHPNESARTIDETTRRRKISVGPIDFEQRREHIRLAYSKSIRESQALDARHRAAERRRKEMDAAAKAKVSAEAVASANAAAAVPTTTADAANADEEEEPEPETRHEAESLGETIGDSTTQSPAEPAVAPLAQPAAPLLAISTSLSAEQGPVGPSTGGIDSPTLGVPGSFPALSPPMNDQEQPLSAVSATSETTEFDVEPQTYPPVQAQSPLEIPITIVKPPSPQTTTPAHPRAEYQYPFEDDAHAQERRLTNPETAQDASQAETARVDDNEPRIPGAFGDELEEPDLTLHAQQSHGTTVTILPPARDGEGGDEPTQTVPFSRLDVQDESDCHSEVENVRQRDVDARQDADTATDAATDACTEGTDDRDRIEFRQPDFRFGDQLSSHRTSTCASSDVGALDDMHYSTHDQPLGAANPSSLMIPRSRQENDRLSQQSAWTDFSVDSTEASDAAKSSAVQSRHESPSFGHVTIFESTTSTRESVSSHRDTHDGSDMRNADDSRRSSAFGQHQLPELDTGGGFSIPYLSHGASASFSYLPSPNHEPPPIPNSASGSALNSRTSSVFYDQSHYGSTLINSERESDEYMSRMETPQSMDTASIETADQYFSSRTPADSDAKSLAQDSDGPTGKERHRLLQRRNVIKELIDTEAVFVRDMNIVEEIYKGTAEACPELDAKTVKLVFRNSDEVIEFHTGFLAQLKEAVASVYVPKGARSPMQRGDSVASEQSQASSGEPNDVKDRATSLGPVFQKNMEKMKLAHEGFLRNSDQAAKRLIQIQQDSTVKVWLTECNEVAKDLTAAWDLDSLLIKPMQRITKYPNLIITLLQHTPQDHPDREALMAAKESLETAIIEINKTKKNFELVGQIVGRKRKESDVKAGFARAFGKRVDKLQTSNNRPPEDPDYAKLNEKFGDDYLRLQVVLRDVEFYTRQVSAYVHEFLQYLSSIELVMRLQPGSYPELESKWVQFNISVRDLEKVALEEHSQLAQVRKHVIEPFELVIKAYGNPSLAMKKRQKRRLDYERSEQLKRAGKSVEPKLRELVEQYDALNDTLLKELPMLSALTEKVGNICLGNFVNIQANWYSIWKEKMKTVLGDCPETPDLKEVVSTFQRDYPYAHEQLASIGILNPGSWSRTSRSTTTSMDDSTIRTSRSRPSDVEARGRGLSINGDAAPTLPAPDFAKRRSGSFTISPSPSATGFGAGPVPSPHHYYYRDYYSGIQAHQGGSASPRSPDMAGSSRSVAATGATSTRPSTGRSFDSGGLPRQSSESASQHRRDSNTTYNSSYPPQESRRYSNLFHSALPLPDGPEDSQRSSRASSRERTQSGDGYNILWLAASLFEFNIATTKHEAGYPYLTYQAGEIFDVIAEKGELWLAKNQDDPTEQVGWIWSKHFAKLADS
ncbi:Rho guanine nucleotide exchange factor gef1 [Tolypocladium paradoxum]|uniref:Rho guanine nucleotide exchange factor gef1 n=1 Tax=Tolypocladium paradoxum TaxID=94208 RepID=A0A2S4LAJ7_9HYPO|nr:Rho guanine nucleotide exchange factor gef1 [Tolypocladium paradoxum]